jgi:hypothetical protein
MLKNNGKWYPSDSYHLKVQNRIWSLVEDQGH